MSSSSPVAVSSPIGGIRIAAVDTNDPPTLELYEVDAMKRLDSTILDRTIESVEIAGEFIVALSATGGSSEGFGKGDARDAAQSSVRAHLWRSNAAWPKALSFASHLRQSRPWLPIHHVSADGSKLATAGADGTIWVWPIAEPEGVDRKDWNTLVRWARASTTACLSVEDRMQYLGESFEVARAAYEACERGFGRTPSTIGPLKK